VDLSEGEVAPLVAALGPGIDVDETALRSAARDRGSWNVIYVPAVTKIDLLVRGTEPFDESEFRRRRRVEVRPGRTLVVKSAGDTVLRKLLWYRAGGSVSDRQWRDVVEVLRQSRAVLDDAWSARLDVAALLERARGEVAR
jgi:hypothetical protein